MNFTPLPWLLVKNQLSTYNLSLLAFVYGYNIAASFHQLQL